MRQGQHIIRRVPRGTAAKYVDLMDQIKAVNDEFSDAHWALVEDMRRLLDLPFDASWEHNDVTIIVTKTPTSIGRIH